VDADIPKKHQLVPLVLPGLVHLAEAALVPISLEVVSVVAVADSTVAVDLATVVDLEVIVADSAVASEVGMVVVAVVELDTVAADGVVHPKVLLLVLVEEVGVGMVAIAAMMIVLPVTAALVVPTLSPLVLESVVEAIVTGTEIVVIVTAIAMVGMAGMSTRSTSAPTMVVTTMTAGPVAGID